MIKKILIGLVICILFSCTLSTYVFAEYYDGSQTKEYYAFDEAKEGQFGRVFIKRNDRFYPISTYEISYGAWTWYNIDNQGFSNADLSSIPGVFLEEGDQLITFENVSEYAFSPVTNIFYAYPVQISIDPDFYANRPWGIVFNYGQDKAYGIDELEGISYFQNSDEVLSILSSKNISTTGADSLSYTRCFLISDQPATLNAGYYDGTEYHETTIQLDYNYVQYGSKITTPVIRTHEGYFIIDLSGIDAGLYVIDVGSNWTNKYVFYINK